MNPTREEIKAIAAEAAQEAVLAVVDEACLRAADKLALTPEMIAGVVHQTLLQMGVDSAHPIEAQKDFQHLRQWRRAGEDLRSKSLTGTLVLFLSGLFGLVILGLKQWFQQ